ncbi:MAG TPA: hypothetical protein VI454_18740 [Verrucomicrobiae bacterium]|jgi:hypothetical protein
MNHPVPLTFVAPIAALVRGEAGLVDEIVRDADRHEMARQVAVIIVGAGLFGAAMGAWRSPTQALYTAVKFPLIVLLTTLANALLNALLAPQLGLDLRLRQTLAAVLTSFAIASLILGSLSPVMLFLVWSAPVVVEKVRSASLGFELVQLTGVAAIAFAGLAGNARMLQSLRRLGGSETVAWRIMIAWLAGNLFLGAQLAWNLRPFIGAPELPVEFLRPNAFSGNFYETVFASLARFLTN